MESMYLLIPLSVVIVMLAGWLFLRMSSGGQFDDLDSPGVRVLLDDDRPRDPPVASGTTDQGSRDFR